MALERIADVKDVPAGEVKVFDLKGRSIAVANTGEKFYACANVCTHDGGPLGEGMLWGDQVECPRHGARFDLKTGRATVFPAVVPVKTYAVQVDGDDVMVEV